MSFAFTKPVKPLDFGRPKPVSVSEQSWEAQFLPADAQVTKIVNAFMRAVEREAERIPVRKVEQALLQNMPAQAQNEINWIEYDRDMTEELTAALLPVYMTTADREARSMVGWGIAKAEVPTHYGWAASFNLTNAYAVRAARTAIGKLIRGITMPQLRAVQWYLTRTILEGIPPTRAARALGTIVGLNPQQTRRLLAVQRDLDQVPLEHRAQALRQVERFEQHMLRERGLLIARTEGIRAAALGQLAAWEAAAQNGYVDPGVWGKRWMARLDNRVCPVCAALNGTVLPFRGRFDGNWEGPPAHPNCRCALGLAKLTGERPEWAKNLKVVPGVSTTGWTAAEFAQILKNADAARQQLGMSKADTDDAGGIDDDSGGGGSYIPHAAWLAGEQAWARRGEAHWQDWKHEQRNPEGEFGARPPTAHKRGAEREMAEVPDADIDADADLSPAQFQDFNDAVQRRLAEMAPVKGKAVAGTVDEVRAELAPQYGVTIRHEGGRRRVAPITTEEVRRHIREERADSRVHDYDEDFRYAVAPDEESLEVADRNARREAHIKLVRDWLLKHSTLAKGRSKTETEAERAARTRYEEGFEGPNPYLRARDAGQVEPDAQKDADVAALDRITTSRVSTVPFKVYRGLHQLEKVTGPEAESARRWLRAITTAERGTIVKDPAFLSTSVDFEGPANNFASGRGKPSMVSIQLPEGTEFGLGTDYEKEIVLPRDGRYMVVGRDQDGMTKLRYLGTAEKPMPMPASLFKSRVEQMERVLDNAIADGMDTQSRYDMIQGVTGKYSESRTAQQEALVRDILSKSKAKHGMRMLFMGGMPGAGKSYWLASAAGKKVVGDLADWLVVDPDGIKAKMAEAKMLPDYRSLELRDEGEATALIHEESSHIANMLAAAAEESGTNVIFDITLNSPDAFKKRVAQATSVGGDYHTTLVFVDSTPAESLQRASERYMRGGRYIRFPWLQHVKLNAEGRTPFRQAYEDVKTLADHSLLVRDGEVIEEAGTAARAPHEELPKLPWREPPTPTGQRGERAAGGWTAVSITNTKLGDLVEMALVDGLNMRSQHPGKRQGPLDLRYDGHGYEVKAASSTATEYKAKLKASEVASKRAYAEEHGLVPHTLIAVYDPQQKELLAYSHPGIGAYRLTSEAQGWSYHGSVRLDLGVSQDPAATPNDVMPNLMLVLAAKGGFTYNPRTDSEPKRGYAVAAHPERGEIHAEEGFSAEDLRAFRDRNADLLTNPRLHIGAWTDEGKIYLDIVEVEPNRRVARKLGRQRNQIAIYDLKTGTEIRTGGTGYAEGQAEAAAADLPPPGGVGSGSRRHGGAAEGERQGPEFDPDPGASTQQRLGRCYELAGRYVSHVPDTELVHGSIQGMGKPRIDHAWALTPSGVYEPASNAIWPGQVFNSVFHPEIHSVYSRPEVFQRTRDTGNWGPWDSEPSANVAPPGVAAWVDQMVSDHPVVKAPHGTLLGIVNFARGINALGYGTAASGADAWNLAKPNLDLMPNDLWDKLPGHGNRVFPADLKNGDLIVTEGMHGGQLMKVEALGPLKGGHARMVVLQDVNTQRLYEHFTLHEVIVVGHRKQASPEQAQLLEWGNEKDGLYQAANALSRIRKAFGSGAIADLTVKTKPFGYNDETMGYYYPRWTPLKAALKSGGEVTVTSHPRIFINESYQVAPEESLTPGDLTWEAAANEASRKSNFHPNADAADATEATVVHELGHAVHWAVMGTRLNATLRDTIYGPAGTEAAHKLFTALAEVVQERESLRYSPSSRDWDGWVKQQEREWNDLGDGSKAEFRKRGYGAFPRDAMDIAFGALGPLDVQQLVSRYAGKDAREFAAEALSEALMSPNPGPVARAVATYMADMTAILYGEDRGVLPWEPQKAVSPEPAPVQEAEADADAQKRIDQMFRSGNGRNLRTVGQLLVELGADKASGPEQQALLKAVIAHPQYRTELSGPLRNHIQWRVQHPTKMGGKVAEPPEPPKPPEPPDLPPTFEELIGKRFDAIAKSGHSQEIRTVGQLLEELGVSGLSGTEKHVALTVVTDHPAYHDALNGPLRNHVQWRVKHPTGLKEAADQASEDVAADMPPPSAEAQDALDQAWDRYAGLTGMSYGGENEARAVFERAQQEMGGSPEDKIHLYVVRKPGSPSLDNAGLLASAHTTLEGAVKSYAEYAGSPALDLPVAFEADVPHWRVGNFEPETGSAKALTLQGAKDVKWAEVEPHEVALAAAVATHLSAAEAPVTSLDDGWQRFAANVGVNPDSASDRAAWEKTQTQLGGNLNAPHFAAVVGSLYVPGSLPNGYAYHGDAYATAEQAAAHYVKDLYGPQAGAKLLRVFLPSWRIGKFDPEEKRMSALALSGLPVRDDGPFVRLDDKLLEEAFAKLGPPPPTPEEKKLATYEHFWKTKYRPVAIGYIGDPLAEHAAYMDAQQQLGSNPDRLMDMYVLLGEGEEPPAGEIVNTAYRTAVDAVRAAQVAGMYEDDVRIAHMTVRQWRVGRITPGKWGYPSSTPQTLGSVFLGSSEPEQTPEGDVAGVWDRLSQVDVNHAFMAAEEEDAQEELDDPYGGDDEDDDEGDDEEEDLTWKDKHFDEVMPTLREGVRELTDIGEDSNFPAYLPGSSGTAYDWLMKYLGEHPHWSDEEYDAVAAYIDGNYHDINQAIANPENATERELKWVADLLAAAHRFQLPKPLRTFRAASPRWVYPPGAEFDAEHYASTSASRNFAEHWTNAARKVLWIIDAPAGTNAIWGTSNTGESEVLYPPDTRFKVLDAWRGDDHTAIMHVTVVNPKKGGESGEAEAPEQAKAD